MYTQLYELAKIIADENSGSVIMSGSFAGSGPRLPAEPGPYVYVGLLFVTEPVTINEYLCANTRQFEPYQSGSVCVARFVDSNKDVLIVGYRVYVPGLV